MPTAIAPSDKKEAPPVWKRMGLAAPEELLLWPSRVSRLFDTTLRVPRGQHRQTPLRLPLLNGHRMFDKDGFPQFHASGSTPGDQR